MGFTASGLCVFKLWFLVVDLGGADVVHVPCSLCMGLSLSNVLVLSKEVAAVLSQYMSVSGSYDEDYACPLLPAEVLDPIKESHLECFHSRSKLTEALGSSPQVGSSS